MSEYYTWRDAEFTLDKRHRWSLHRAWHGLHDERKEVLFVMLNPSQAGKTEDDPTIRRCVGFARRWGCTGVRVMNLFSLVATNPRELFAAGHGGPLYRTHMLLASKSAALTVVAWGALPQRGWVLNRAAEVLTLLKDPQCLGLTNAGFPKHPLYVPYSAQLRPYDLNAVADHELAAR